VFERDTSHMMAHADTLMVIGQNEYLYNRNNAFNAALIRARAANVVYFDRDTDLPEDALASILPALDAAASHPWSWSMPVEAKVRAMRFTPQHFAATTRSWPAGWMKAPITPVSIAGRMNWSSGSSNAALNCAAFTPCRRPPVSAAARG